MTMLNTENLKEAEEAGIDVSIFIKSMSEPNEHIESTNVWSDTIAIMPNDHTPSQSWDSPGSTPAKAPSQTVQSKTSFTCDTSSTDTKISPITKQVPKVESILSDSTRKYNLRPKSAMKPIIKRQYDLSWNKLTHRSKKVRYKAEDEIRYISPRPSYSFIPKSEDDFRDFILAPVDVQTYHQHVKDEFVKKVIEMSSASHVSQLDSFTHESRNFIAVCWLTSLRIFEHLPHKGVYIEVKRIPERYITISSQILTSIHCDNQYFYLAYLWGCKEEDADLKQSYIEIRDIRGNMLIDKPFYYDYEDGAVKDIYSDAMYIYVKLSSNVIYLHRRNFFGTIFYRLDYSEKSLQTLIDNPIERIWVLSTTISNGCTKLRILTVTSNHIIVSIYDRIRQQRLVHSHKFSDNDSFKMDSLTMIKNKKYIVLSTATTNPSNLNEGYSSKIQISALNSTNTLEPNISLSLQCHVIQMKVFDNSIYLLGYIETFGVKQFQIGCCGYSSKTQALTPKWTSYLNGVDEDTRILVHHDNIALIKKNQQVSSLPLDNNERTECKCCQIGFLKKEDKILHENHSKGHMFFKYQLHKTQVPRKTVIREKKTSEYSILDTLEDSSQNSRC